MEQKQKCSLCLPRQARLLIYEKGDFMSKMGHFKITGVNKFQTKLNKLKADQTKAFVEECAKELAARLLAKVIHDTPVGKYPPSTGKRGGTLRRGWTIGEIRKEGNMISVDVINPVEYASYVEYGHRTRDHQGWIPGRFMLTISEQEIQAIAPNVLEMKIAKMLKDHFAS